MNRKVDRGDYAILVVDDDPTNIRLIERMLNRSGYTRIHSTTDPTETSHLFMETAPDLVMLDLQMPKVDGFGVMEELAGIVDADDYLPILILTADTTRTTKQRALVSGAHDFLTKPFDQTEMLARVGNLLKTRSMHLQLRRLNQSLEKKVEERTAVLWETIGQLEGAQRDLRLAQEETIHKLSFAAEFRDDETSRHIERMSRYCSVIAEGVGFDQTRKDTLRIASKMHDVGKIGVPDSILLKPGKLTPDQFEIMKTHSQIGYDILTGSASDLASTAAMIAWTHHEKIDGSGYPRGLVGDEIPLEGRIAAVADVFDALTTDRVYRKAFTLPETLTIMREGRGAHFEPAIVDVLFDRLDEILTLKSELDEMPAEKSFKGRC